MSFAVTPLMLDVRWAATLLGASLALAGCASEVSGQVGSSDPAPHASTATASAPSVEKTASVSEAARRTTEGATQRCSPYECCFPNVSGGWQDNAFEADLRALGCTTPSPYELDGDRLWLWTQCPFDLGVIATVFRYAGTPYDARFVENACLSPQPGTADVIFDPTCSTCIVDPSAPQ